MKKYGRIFLTLAILFGLAAQAQATSYDPTNLVQPVNTIRMNQGGQGDALVGEWYRATVGTNFDGQLDNSNFLTYVSIVNTSNDWVAAHVRLRTGRYSIEAIDFPILLSPRDVFWFQFEAQGTGSTISAVRIWSADTKTVIRSGLSSTGVWENDLSNSILKSFTTLAEDFPNQVGIQELAIGYMEVIGLWKMRFTDAPGAPVSEAALPAGVTFQNLQSAFYNNGAANGRYRVESGSTTSRFLAPMDLGNVLTGQVFMGDFTNGLYTGYAMTALADFRTNCPQFDDSEPPVEIGPRHRDEFIRAANGLFPILGALGERGAIVYNPLNANPSINGDPAYTDPDWATNFGPTWNDGDDWTQGGTLAFTSFSLDEVDDALAKQKATSTYFNGGFREERSTFTMATITFPTKYLHVNFLNFPVGLPAQASNFRAELDVPGTVGNVSLFGGVWDLEERPPINRVSPYLLANLKWEVNCVPIGTESRRTLEEFCFLTHVGINLDVDASFFAGWFEMRGFGLLAPNGDPRTNIGAQGGYDRGALPLLSCLANNTGTGAGQFGYNSLIPALVQTLDFEFAGFLHARSFAPAWDNPNTCDAGVLPPVGCDVDANNLRF